jgi:hypothetical protein
LIRPFGQRDRLTRTDEQDCVPELQGIGDAGAAFGEKVGHESPDILPLMHTNAPQIKQSQ